MTFSSDALSRWLKVLLALLFIVLLASGMFFYHIQEKVMCQKAEEDLAAIARLKVEQIAAWRKDRLDDAEEMQEHSFLSENVARFLAVPDERNAGDLRVRFRNFAAQNEYAGILLVDLEGKVLVSINETAYHPSEYAPALAAALSVQKPVFTDIHIAREGEPPHISVVAPVFARAGESSQPIGGFILVTNTSQFLYPLVQFWPTPSKTAETLLVRRDGDNVLFLNELRHKPDAALKLRIPLTRTEVPAVQAVLGREGMLEGIDYRGVEVVSFILPVPDSPWFMVAKVDAAEVFAEWRFRSILILAFILGMAAFIGTAGLVLWQREKAAHYHALYSYEAALRTTVERHSITLKAIGDAVIATDAQGLVELLNPVAETLTGWTDAEARGKPLETVFHIINEETREIVEGPVAVVLREGVVVGLANHTLLIARDGVERPIADSGAPIFNEEGVITGVVLVFRDQTAERAARLALQESEECFRATFEQAAVGIAHVAPNGCFLRVNNKLCGIVGYSQEELLTKTFREITDPDYVDTDLALVQQVLDGTIKTYSREKRYIHKNGFAVWINITVALAYKPNGEPDYLISVIEEISERKKAEEELLRSEERYRSTLDNMMEGCQIIDFNWRYVYINAAAEGHNQCRKEELLGKRYMDVWPGVEETEVFVHIQRCLEERISEQMENLFVFPNGTKGWFDLTIQPVPEGVFILSIDITQRRQAEEQLQHLANVLRAVRNVNQLITHEKSRDILLREACGVLTKTRGYRSAWISLFDGAGGMKCAVQSGLGEEFAVLCTEIEQGNYPDCCRQAIENSGFVAVYNTKENCAKCPLEPVSQDTAVLAGALRHAERDYGVLVVALPAAVAGDPEEQSLFKELCGDIGYALFMMEMEADHEKSERTLRAIFDSASDGVLLADAVSGSFVVGNNAICQMLGYSIQEIKELSIADIHPVEELAAVHKRFAGLGLGESSFVSELPVKRKDGSIFYADINTTAFELDGRRHMLGIFRDITERKQAAAERERLLSAIEQAGEMIVISDPEGIIQYVNPAFERTTGYLREEAIGQNWRILKSGKQGPVFYQHLWETISSGQTWKGRIINMRKDGTLYTEEATISPVCDASGHVLNYVAVKHDITEHLQLAEQFKQAQKMESVGRLAGGVAHDYNNMLSVILGYTEMALDKVGPSESLHADLKEIYDAAKRSTEVTRQLLAFARKQTISPKILDLNDTVEGMLKMLRRLIGEDIDLAWRPGSGLGWIKMDPAQIDQMLANLCVNARDAINGVGKVTVETHMASFDEDYCASHAGFVPGEYVQLAVSDDGCGMDKETLDSIFEPFFTTKDVNQGTGLD